jgi:glucan biosynthesis protein
MNKYCKCYHQLVNEFKPDQIKEKVVKSRTLKHKRYEPNLENLLKKLYNLVPDINNKLNFNTDIDLFKRKNYEQETFNFSLFCQKQQISKTMKIKSVIEKIKISD